MLFQTFKTHLEIQLSVHGQTMLSENLVVTFDGVIWEIKDSSRGVLVVAILMNFIRRDALAFYSKQKFRILWSRFS